MLPSEKPAYHGHREACDDCHHRKVRCVPSSNGACNNCMTVGAVCKYSPRTPAGRPRKKRMTSFKPGSQQQEGRRSSTQSQANSKAASPELPNTSMYEQDSHVAPGSMSFSAGSTPTAMSQHGLLTPKEMSDVVMIPMGPDGVDFGAPGHSMSGLSMHSQNTDDKDVLASVAIGGFCLDPSFDPSMSLPGSGLATPSHTSLSRTSLPPPSQFSFDMTGQALPEILNPHVMKNVVELANSLQLCQSFDGLRPGSNKLLDSIAAVCNEIEESVAMLQVYDPRLEQARTIRFLSEVQVVFHLIMIAATELLDTSARTVETARLTDRGMFSRSSQEMDFQCQQPTPPDWTFGNFPGGPRDDFDTGLAIDRSRQTHLLNTSSFHLRRLLGIISTISRTVVEAESDGFTMPSLGLDDIRNTEERTKSLLQEISYVSAKLKAHSPKMRSDSLTDFFTTPGAGAATTTASPAFVTASDMRLYRD